VQGPRQDAGTLPGQGNNPGIGLVQRIYNYVQQKTQGATKIMVSGVRTSEGVQSLILPAQLPWTQSYSLCHRLRQCRCTHELLITDKFLR